MNVSRAIYGEKQNESYLRYELIVEIVLIITRHSCLIPDDSGFSAVRVFLESQKRLELNLMLSRPK